MFFWVQAPCGLVGRSQCFGEAYCCHSGLKMETVRFSKMLASTNQPTWRLNPEEHHHRHLSENLKSHMSRNVVEKCRLMGVLFT
jgi:hypothetical protein